MTHLTDAQEWAGNGSMVGAIKARGRGAARGEGRGGRFLTIHTLIRRSTRGLMGEMDARLSLLVAAREKTKKNKPDESKSTDGLETCVVS